VVELADAELSLREIEAGLAGGRLAGELSFARGPVGVAARGRLALHEVEASQILPGDGALSGRLTVEVSAQGSGRSPVALIGSLDGTGRFTLDNGRVARIDPKVFEALLRAVDQGLPIDAARVRDFIEKALAAGTVAVSRAEGALTVRDGQARLADAQLRADAELTVAGSANLSEGGLDARLVLSGPLGMAGLAGERPTLVMTLKGPFEAPKRTIDVAALSSWLALRAVEQQSQKLELLEGRAPTAAVAPAPAAVQPAAVPNGTGEQPQGRPDAAAPATTAPAAQAESDVKPRPATRPKPKPADPARPLDLRQFLFGPRS
jgi:large subunit ribosomal protein L24